MSGKDDKAAPAASSLVGYVLPPVIGRPTKYHAGLCERVVELGRQGKSHAQIAAGLDVARETLYQWAAQYPEFSDAITRARELSQAWFEDVGQAGMLLPGFNAALWAKQVSCRFREEYTDTSKHELTGKDGKDLPPATIVFQPVAPKDE